MKLTSYEIEVLDKAFDEMMDIYNKLCDDNRKREQQRLATVMRKLDAIIFEALQEVK